MLRKLPDNSIVIVPRYTKELQTRLLRRGVPLSAFNVNRITLSKNICKVAAELKNVNVRRIGIAAQIKRLISIYKKSLTGNYVLTISSFPSNTLAKRVALDLMAQATISHAKLQAQGKLPPHADSPYWYVMTPGPQKVLEEKPSLLVVSNVFSDSTPYRREAVRDLLGYFDHIPRIVVGSPSDPITFASEINYASNFYLYIGPKDKDSLRV